MPDPRILNIMPIIDACGYNKHYVTICGRAGRHAARARPIYVSPGRDPGQDLHI